MAFFSSASRRSPSRLIALATVALAPQAPARTYFWAGGNRDFWGNDNWLQGDGSYVHPLSDRLNTFIFGKSSNGAVVLDDNGYVTNDIAYDFIVGNLYFFNQAYVLNGKSLLLYGRNTIDVDPSCPSLQIDLNLKMDNDILDPTATLSLDVAASSTLTVNGEIYGTGALYKADFGTAILKGFHNYTEGTNVAAGRLVDYNPHGNYYTNADLEFNIGGDVTHGGRIFGGGAVTKSGAGTLYLNGDASWTGATNIDSGRLIVATPWSSSSYGVSAGAALEFRTGTGNYTHDIYGGGSFTKSGPGVLTLTGNNTYTGGTTVTEGALIDKNPHGGYANNSILYFETAGNHTLDKPISGTGILYKTGSGTVTLAGLNTFTGLTTVLEGALIDYNPHGAYGVASELQFVGTHTYSNVIAGGGHFTKGGPGVLTLTNINTYTGGTTVDGGTLIDHNPHGNYKTNSQLEFRNAGDVVFSDPNTGNPYVISGLGHFTKSGAGALLLLAPNSYAASTAINEGAIATLANNALPATTNLTVGANGLLLLGSGISQTVASLAGAGRVTLQSNNLTVNGAASTEFSGAVSGNGALVKAGAGTLTLSGVNTYSAGTNVNGGRLIDANPHGTYVTNAALEFSKATDYSYGTAITGTGSFTKSGAGILTLSGINTYSGGTIVNGGRLIDLNPHGDYTTNATLEFKNAADSTYNRTIDGTGTFIKSGTGTLSVTGSIKNLVKVGIAGGTLKGSAQSFQGDVTGVGGATLQFEQTSNGAYAAKYSGGGALLKTGNGTLTMSNAPTNTGGSGCPGERCA